MGIRFRCHHCEHELNLKNFQAGRRARCPSCSGRFRVPTTSQDFSMPLEEAEEQLASTSLNRVQSAALHSSPNFELQEPNSDLGALARRPPEALAEKPAQPDQPSGAISKQPQSQSQAQPQSQAQRQPRSPVQPQAGATAEQKATAEQPVQQKSGAAAGVQVPRAIAEAPQAVWYVRPPNGGQFGPADGQTFFQWMQENRVARDALVWRDGWPQWLVAAEAFEDTYGSKWSVGVDEERAASDSGAAAPETVDIGGDLATAGSDSERLEASATASVPLGGLPPRREPLSAARRKRIRNNYAIGIAVLALLAVGLVIVLVYVVAMK